MGIVLTVLQGATLLAQQHPPVPTTKPASQEPKKFDELISAKGKVSCQDGLLFT
jgi:hypothetical protein